MTIRLSKLIDLGKDKVRMSNPEDKKRQTQTVDAILERLYTSSERHRMELQILADEVGMGKTFVALASAFSVLESMREGRASELGGCYQKILVVTPDNDALYRKWVSETSEFVGRCVNGDAKWFEAARCDRIDELVRQLRSPKGATVLVIKTNRLESNKLKHRSTKHQFMFSALCRYWGKRFPIEHRDVLLRGAPEGWPRTDNDVGRYYEAELQYLHFYEEEFKTLLGQIESSRDEDARKMMEETLEWAKDLGTPFRQYRDVDFPKFAAKLSELYVRICFEFIRQSFPLVIVDEAHNWKNGPRGGANAYDTFARYIAPKSRRILLLTATPFQLRPSEILEILKVGDHLGIPTERQERLKKIRENTIEVVLKRSEQASRHFAKAWARLPRRIRTEDLEDIWESESLRRARDLIMKQSKEPDVIDDEFVQTHAKIPVTGLDPAVRGFFMQALLLYGYNADLSDELGKLVIRHRRTTAHRLVRVGSEFSASSDDVEKRPDRSFLHVSAGLNVEGEPELPHYVLMRAVSELKHGRGKTALGTSLTGTYSTLTYSNEGASLRRAMSDGNARFYFSILRGMVSERRDPAHPKVKALVDQIIRMWERGEKYLIFCFRVHTARRLRDILRDEIEHIISSKRQRILGSENALKNLRSRMSGRERDLMPLVLDRVIWSRFLAGMADGHALPVRVEDFGVKPEDFRSIALAALKFGVDLRKEQLDRVFLHRAFEHILAKRLLATCKSDREFITLLRQIADPNWIGRPYGLDRVGESEEQRDDVLFNQRKGVQHVYPVVRDDVSEDEIETLARAIRDRESKAGKSDRRGILESIALAPNLWLGNDPMKTVATRTPEILALHRCLWKLSPKDQDVSLEDRLHLFAAFRRAVLRESTLVRLLPEKSERGEESWGELLTDRIMAPLPNQTESFFHRLVVFAEDYKGSSGTVQDKDKSRYAIIDSTMLHDESLISLVEGNTKQRNRIFSAFNTPLVPEILICTQVGQEGIDLHRYCRYVVHYDLPWNPASLEQRTGRADRIGSKAFRERDAETKNGGHAQSFLEVGIPYLAGTYDERIYEELRVRAQTFEVLTGGDHAPDHAEGQTESGKDDEGRENGWAFITLPASMMEDLRVRLNVV